MKDLAINNALKVLKEQFQRVRKQSETVMQWEKKLWHGASCRLFDTLSFMTLSTTKVEPALLTSLGFIEKETSFYTFHPLLPSVYLTEEKSEGLTCQVDSLCEFYQTNNVSFPVEGSPYSSSRLGFIEKEALFAFAAQESNGSLDPKSQLESIEEQVTYQVCLELWQTRERDQSNPNFVKATYSLAATCCKLLGKAKATKLILSCERDYWEKKCRTGALQKLRQDTFGIGWSNRAYHTFRIFRHHANVWIELLTLLGFRFATVKFSGLQEGIGRYIYLQEEAKELVCLELDTTQEEKQTKDLEKTPLKNRQKPGAVDLWCQTYGESWAKGGLFDLGVKLSLEKAQEDLKAWEITFEETLYEEGFFATNCRSVTSSHEDPLNLETNQHLQPKNQWTCVDLASTQ